MNECHEPLRNPESTLLGSKLGRAVGSVIQNFCSSYVFALNTRRCLCGPSKRFGRFIQLSLSQVFYWFPISLIFLLRCLSPISPLEASGILSCLEVILKTCTEHYRSVSFVKF